MKKNKPSVAKKAENEVAIKVENLSKTFKIPLEASNGIKQKLINTLKGVKGYREFSPLNDISFEINKGDFFGIVGRNGSGKSTLLKTMAGIYTPNTGSVTVNGSLVPFIELGVGFNPELTGRENVFLNGALLGFSHEEMEGMYQEIVDFAEIEEFMDEKLKNYSSGMQVRLAFSIAIQAKGDILLLDEVLAVGDEAFQRKCFNYFAELKRDKKTVVLVTHSMDSVKKYCNKAMLIEGGKITAKGDPGTIADQYTLENFESKKNNTKGKHDNTYLPGLSSLVPEFYIKPITKQILTSQESFKFELVYKITKDIPVRFGISLIDEMSGGVTSVFDDQIRDENGKLLLTSNKKGTYRFIYKIPLERFNNRKFMITAMLFKVIKDGAENIAFTSENNVGRFMISGEKHDGGLLKNKGEWTNI